MSVAEIDYITAVELHTYETQMMHFIVIATSLDMQTAKAS
jgi:hypothetical protein